VSASFPLLCLCIMPSSFSLVFSSSGAFGVLSLCSGERGNWNPLSWSSEGRPAISLACFSLFSFSNPPLVFHQFFLWFPPFQSPRFCPFLPVFPRFFFSLSAWIFRVPPPPPPCPFFFAVLLFISNRAPLHLLTSLMAHRGQKTLPRSLPFLLNRDGGDEQWSV
jgi:hypothetical protein